MPVADPSSPTPSELADDLELIAEMTADFARSHHIEDSLRIGLAHIANRLEAQAASLFLLDDSSGELVCRACWGPTDVTGLRLEPGNGIVWRTIQENRPQLVADTARDPDFAPMVDRITGFTTRSILCAPMRVRDRSLGAIELFNKGSGHFDADDRRVLQALASAAALALINARNATAMAEREALRHELALAADIQRAMLPQSRPDDFPIHGLNVAARGVSGDFFDVVELGDGRLAFAIADVSGKGMNAALLMAKTASLFRCLAKRLDGPGDILAAIDAELAETGSAGMFVTMIAGILDPVSGIAVLANAGHEPPLLLAPGCGPLVIRESMPPLGVDVTLFADGCPETRIDLGGGRLYLYTDGLTEARDPDGHMLGAQGILGMLERLNHLGGREALRMVLAETVRSGKSLRDDLTMMVVEDLR